MKFKRQWLVSTLITYMLLGCAATYESAQEKYMQGDIAEAREEWRELAEQGDKRAMYRLYDTARNKSSVDFQWLKKAAQLEHPQAKYELGINQIKDENYTVGIQNLKEAAELGEENASDWLSKHTTEVKWWPKAEQGNTYAMVKLGEHYKNKERPAYPQSLKWFKRAADKEDSVAYFYLGVMHNFGYGVPVDDVKAVKWYKLSADQGNRTAMFNLCLKQRDGEGIVKDASKARQWCKQAHQKGNTDATTEYARMLVWGIGGTAAPKQGMKLLEPLVDINPYAALNLGEIYFNGMEVELDYNRAFDLYTKAHNGNDKITTAAYRLATIYDKGLGRTADQTRAFYWFEVAAQRGEAYSQRRTALYYYKGNVVGEDKVTASEWFEKSAKGGDTIAAYYIGKAYLNGVGVRTDYRKAEQYLLQSAKSGDKDAQFQLGYEYHKGDRFNKDEDEFFHWTQQSANQDHSVAQYNLSIAYANGFGVKQNYAWAAYWRAKSADQNYSSAIESMDEILIKLNKYTVSSNTNIYSKRDTASNVVAKINKGDIVYRTDNLNNWYEVVSASGYHLGFVETNKLSNWKKKPKLKTTMTASSPFPARPEKVSGKVSCNTRCINSTCWRTYDDGKQVKFQAQQKFNALTGQFEWDSGSCVN
ncbi:conserved exported hypothetical protein [Vibrio crassostreae]|nr:conserved exported hypothetical protein [Vibrio crassostreae]CAK3106618.1 conserved exported hypothetical protein [Vibrio crassostreae]CAK3177152.1 conserved exported hypothetical protein [Vibrio crassostreae]CAK3198486.1 conserved exported hypothetical protein [Vibrio crassostreae]CAK3209703.1 conserved exported hypothetical protein [Vibrio crassostreae]